MNDGDDDHNRIIIKTRLSDIICNKDDIFNINDLVYRTNIIVIHTYQFIKLYLLHLYENNLIFPKINKLFIERVISIVSTNATRTRPAKNTTVVAIRTLTKFYNDHYIKTINQQDIPSRHKTSNILQYEATDILKNITNMIKFTYVEKIRKFVKIYFHSTIINDVKKTKEEKKKDNEQINLIVKDIINIDDIKCNNLKSNEKFHEWIKAQKYKIITKKNNYKENSLFYDIRACPLTYLKRLFYICKEVEKISINKTCNRPNCNECKNKKECEYNPKIKLFSVFPLRTRLKPQYITIDSYAVLNSLFTKNISKYQGKVNNNKNVIWKNICNLDNKIFKKNKYNFSHTIKTDGIGCSIIFYPTNKEEMVNKKGGLKNIKKRKKKEKGKELYLNDVKMTDNIKHKNIVGIDVGKNNLLYCIDNKSTPKKKNILKYTRIQRSHETRTKRYNNTINDIKNRNKKIIRIEQKLSLMTAKTTYFNKYQEYIEYRNKNLTALTKFYNNERLRIFRWFRYINTQRSEAKLIKNFKKKFGDFSKTIIAIGDYGQKHHMPHIEPTKGIGFRRMFRRQGYRVYLINEFRTSKRCHWCDNGETEKFMSVKNSDGKEVLINGLLRCQNDNCTKGHYTRIFNRDLNGALNILEIANAIIKGKPRPKKFRRDKKNKNIEVQIIPAKNRKPNKANRSN
jgi:hypothetical protein